MDRAQLHGRWMIDPDDVAGFEQLGLHGFEFDKHGDVVLSALGDGGMGRALFCWRLENSDLVLEEVASKTQRRHLVYFEEPDVLRLDGARYLRREEKPIDVESGLFCIGSAGIRHALASIGLAAPEGVESFSPLLLLDGEDALVAERVDGLQGARERARASKALRCAYVHDGSAEGARAVVAVASERGRPKGRTLLLRYRFANGAVECMPPLDSAPSENFW